MDKRLKILRNIIFVCLAILLLRAGYLQLVQGEYYRQLSEGNRTSYRPINAPRGKIYGYPGDNGELQENLLVTNTLSYNINLLPNEIPAEVTIEELLSRLLEITDLELENEEENPLDYMLQIYNNNRIEAQEQWGSFYTSFPILLKRNISAENMLLIRENQEDLPGIVIEEFPARDYVHDELAAHVIGYVGEIDSNELEKYNQEGKNYRVGDYIGKTGLEASYEDILRGTGGMEQVEVNNRGAKIQTLGVRPPETGNNLILNLDLELQREAEQLLEENIKLLREDSEEEEENILDINTPAGGSVIVMEVDTGAVRAMASYPDFDLNLFGRGISQTQYRELTQNPQQPFLNRNTAEHPAGSVFKLVTGTTAIEELNIDGDTTFVDEDGTFRIPGWSRPFHNWNPQGEGEINFTRAIARSNNIVFYELGYELYQEFRGEKLAEHARNYGFGEVTGIDLPHESSGLVPDREWKQRTRGEGWYPGDSVNLAIGQGGLLVTPLQLLNMTTVIANEGTGYQPQLVNSVVDSKGETITSFSPEKMIELDLDSETYSILQEGMVEATATSYGTASGYFDDFPFQVAGKTGTAQTAVGGENHGWFVGFAPADDPEIAFVVFLEKGMSSINALPIARGVLDTYFTPDDSMLRDFDLFNLDPTLETYDIYNYLENIFPVD